MSGRDGPLPEEVPTAGATYAGAGVDIDAGDRAVGLIRPWVAKAGRPEVVGGLGGFAGLFALDTTRWKQPLLASSTDGVGTKLAIAQALDTHDTIGRDLVAMVVDDVAVCGAEPLFLSDYVACGRLVPERLASIVSGIATGCQLAGCALVGGETAEHPGLLQPDEYDVAGTAVGVVEADRVLGPERVRPGDVLVAMGSSGMHSNGYSLARHVLLERAGFALDALPPELGPGRTLGAELLEPTRIYALDCLALNAALADSAGLHALVHVTGGGIPGNLPRALPAGTHATVDRSTWRPQPVFDLIARHGNVVPDEMERTFNMGVGMVAVVSAEAADTAVATLTERGVPAWVCGSVTGGDQGVETPAAATAELVSTHPA